MSRTPIDLAHERAESIKREARRIAEREAEAQRILAIYGPTRVKTYWRGPSPDGQLNASIMRRIKRDEYLPPRDVTRVEAWL
jgi:hypothetical protein